MLSRRGREVGAGIMMKLVTSLAFSVVTVLIGK